MERKEKVVYVNSDAKLWLIGIVMFFIGACGLYMLMYFFPEPFIKTITEQIETKNITVTDSGIADAVDKIYDAVVVVKTYVKDDLYSTGTGFVYKKEGDKAYILTNNHVIESGDAIYVEFTDGKIVETKVEGKDLYSDTAVLSLSANEVLAIAAMGSSETARIGDTVFTVGAPINSDTYSGTVTRGILSGKNRLVGVSTTNSSTSDLIMSVLQTDAAINSGNSGGPLVNSNGEVIGITSLKLATTGVEGMGFAIPIETALSYAAKEEKGEEIERPQLGITMRNLKEAMYYHYPKLNHIELDSGVYVENVTKDSPAEAGGIKSGDIIIKVDDKDVTDLAKLRYLLFNHSVGDKMKVTVYRDGKNIDLELLLNKKLDN